LLVYLFESYDDARTCERQKVISLVTSLRLTQFGKNIGCPKTQYTKPHKEIRTHDAENIFDLLHSCGQKLTLDHPVEFRKQSACKESVEPNERNVLVLKLIEGRRLVEGGIKLFEGIDWNEHGAATTGQGFDVCGSVHHSIIRIENPIRCHSVSKFYFIFI
jgi:hypothetical protein